MRRLFLAVSISIFLFQFSYAAQQAAPPPPAKSTITGSVVKATNGDPLPRVQVSLTRVGAASNPQALDATSTPGARGAAPAPQQQGNVQVQVAQAQVPGGLPTVTTDDMGVFVLKDVPAGSYRVSAVRNGYSRQEFGQRSVGRPGTVLNVRPGQTVADIAFRMTPAATIAGRVIDANGDPLPGVSVQALRSTYDATGKRQFQPVGVAKTNDLGEYRLYWMNPGRYVVNANAAATGLEAIAAMSAQATAGQTPNSPEEAQLMAQSQSMLGPGKNPNEANNAGFVVNYYPNTPDPTRATSVELQPGAEIRGIDFTLTKDQKVHIRGKIIDAGTGKPPQMAQVSLSPRNGGGNPLDALMGGLGGALQGNTYNSTTGEFEAREVASGSYYLQVMSQATMPTPNPGGANTADVAAALATLSSINNTKVPIDVYGSDIDNVNITVTPGVTIPGRLRIEGGPAAIGNTQNPYDRYTVSLAGSGGIDILALLGGGGGGGKPDKDGAFSLPRTVPGDYKVSISGMVPTMYIKEARLDQTDALGGVTIGERVTGALDITISPNAGQLEGNITDNLTKPVTGVQAVLIPDTARNRHELYKTASTDANGHYILRGIAPGNYKLFAWEDIEAFSYFDPEVLRTYEQQGKPIVIKESDKDTLDMKIIPATPQ